MATALRNGQMGPSTKESGEKTRQMGKASWRMLMAIFMKASGKMTKLTVMDNICMRMEPHIQAIGWKISRKVEVLRHGLMVRGTRVSTRRGRSMERGAWTLQMAAYIRETLRSMKSKGSESTHGPMERHMKVSGKAIKCTVKVCCFGGMERVIRAAL